MRLLVVYGLKTTNYDWLKQFYPTVRLSEICENRGIQLRFLFPQDISRFLLQADAREFSPDKTLCLIRGECPLSVVQQLEKAGYACYNSSRALSLANDKLKSYEFLTQNRYPSPYTEAFLPSSAEISNKCTLPFVLKPRNGSRGRSVHLIHTQKELRYIIDTEHPREGWIIQSYIEDSHGRDLRIFFAQGTVLASVIRCGPKGAFLSNACTGGSLSLADRNSPSIQTAEAMALEIGQAAGLWYGTVDFLFSTTNEEAEFTVGEINASPGFEALEKNCKINIVSPLLETLFPS